jgi:hypothetical protein
MNKFIANPVIPLLSPIAGHAQQHKRALVSALHRSHFKIDKLSKREERTRTYVEGEITSNAKKEASTVFLTVRWFDKENKIVATSTTHVNNLAPDETLRFQTYTDKNPEIVRYDVTIKSVHE